MSRPNTMFSEPRQPDLVDLPRDWHAPTLSPVDFTEGCKEDVQAISAALAHASRAIAKLADADTSHSKLEAHVAVNQLEGLIGDRLVGRVKRVALSVRARTT